MDFPILTLLDTKASIAWIEQHFHRDGFGCPHCQASLADACLFRTNRGSGLPVYRCRKCQGVYTLYTRTIKEKARLQAALAGQLAEHAVPDIAKVASHLWDMPALLTQATPLERNAVYREIFDRVWIEAHKIRTVTPTRIYERLMIVTSQVIHYGGPGGLPRYATNPS
jgi:hypothetical protein